MNLEHGKYYEGPFSADQFVKRHAEALSSAGYLPEVTNDVVTHEIRRTLSSQDFLNRKTSKNETYVPKGWGEGVVFHLGSIDENGFVWVVDLAYRISDGRQLVLDAAKGIQEDQDKFCREHPELSGEKAYVAWLNSASDF